MHVSGFPPEYVSIGLLCNSVVAWLLAVLQPALPMAS